MLVSSSLSGLPPRERSFDSSTTKEGPRRNSGSAGHIEKIRSMSAIVAAYDMDNSYNEPPSVAPPSHISPVVRTESVKDKERERDRYRDRDRSSGDSPSNLSEVSEMDRDDLGSKYVNTQTETASHTRGKKKTRSNQGASSAAVIGGPAVRTYSQHDEIYCLHDFQWKKGSEILGEGTFGQVYKGMNLSTGELLAVKQICLTGGTEEEVSILRREIDLMDSLTHPNIVR